MTPREPQAPRPERREQVFFSDSRGCDCDSEGIEIGEDGPGFFVRFHQNDEEYTHRLQGEDADAFSRALETLAMRHLRRSSTRIRMTKRLAAALAYIAASSHTVDDDDEMFKEAGTSAKDVYAAIDWITAHHRSARRKP